ncbi:MAG: hypothetical protein AB7E81_17260 [Hyphomicrobiaceae bacterium]
MPVRHRLTALSVLLLVLSAASIVHSSAAAHAQPVPQTSSVNDAVSLRPLVGKAGEGLPAAAADMRAAILEAVHTGRLDDLREAIELNEIRPVIGNGQDADPLVAIRKASRDGQGRDVLDALGRILEAEWIAVPRGADIENNLVYVWPRFAETGVVGLKADEKAALAVILPADALAPTLEKGVYDHWRIGIAADGTWHFLRR